MFDERINKANGVAKLLRPLLAKIKMAPPPVSSSFDAVWIGGSTTRAFQAGRPLPNTIAETLRARMKQPDNVKSLRAILNISGFEDRIQPKLDLAENISSGIIARKNKDREDLGLSQGQKLKVIDLALKEYIFYFKPEERRFERLDVPLDSYSLKCLIGLNLNGGRKLPKDPRMGSIKSVSDYKIVQSEIDKILGNGIEDKWEYDFIMWNIQRVPQMQYALN